MPTAQMTARVRIASMHPNVAGLALGRKRAAKLGSDSGKRNGKGDRTIQRIVKRVANRVRISRAAHPLSDRRPAVRRYPIGGCPGGGPQAS